MYTCRVPEKAMTRNMTFVVGLVVLFAACANDSPSPSAPTPTPTPTPTPVLQVVNYAGEWAGTYTVTACRQTSDFYGQFCGSMSTGGASSIEMMVVQRGSDVTGSLSLGSDVGSLSGVVDTAGHLLTTAQTKGLYNIGVTNWNTTMSGRQMVGTFTQEWRSSDGSAGSGQVDCTLKSFTKNLQ
jgi:hypothetical protein